MRQSIKDLIAEYGTVALVVYLTIFALTLAGFAFAIKFGWRPDGVAGNAGVLAAAYIAAKVTQPLRIVATVLLTPVVAKLYERVARRSGTKVGDSA